MTNYFKFKILALGLTLATISIPALAMGERVRETQKHDAAFEGKILQVIINKRPEQNRLPKGYVGHQLKVQVVHADKGIRPDQIVLVSIRRFDEDPVQTYSVGQKLFFLADELESDLVWPEYIINQRELYAN